MTENNDFNNSENERYCVRAGYWHNYTGIGRCEDENLTTNEVCDLINEQHETIQSLKKENWKLKRAKEDLYHQNDRLRVLLRKNGISTLG